MATWKNLDTLSSYEKTFRLKIMWILPLQCPENRVANV